MKTIPMFGPMFVSNQTEKLAAALIERLFASFCKRKVVVPDSQMRTFLSLHIAQNSKRKIAMGMELLTLEQLKKEAFGNRIESALRLEHRIATTPKTEELFAPLMHYLETSQTPLSQFCGQLARVFERYTLYGEESLTAWLEKKGWQQTLWKELRPAFKLPGDYEWHVFGFNFLPNLYTQVFKRAGASFYLLSPCQYFWEDLCSNKERARLEKHLGLAEKEALETYLQDHHLFLANMGKLGRSFLKQLQDLDVEDLYVESLEKTALHQLQKSLLELQPLEEPLEDSSIQLHPVSSPFQEIELVFATLQALILEQGIEPKEIHVMAADINVYVPYIHMVFGREEVTVPYSICDVELSAENAFVQGFLQLFRISTDRFDPASIFKLCNSSAFYEKQGLSAVQRERLELWAEKTCVRWGADAEQRDLFLKEKMLEESNTGTWARGFEQLLLGLAMLSPDLPSVEISEAELLEWWITLIRGLKEDLRPLMDGTCRTAAAWFSFLKDLANKYFHLDEEDEKLLSKLDLLHMALQDLSHPIFPFSSIHSVVEKLFTAPAGSYKTSCVQSVLFSSFPQGSPVPKRVIWLLGMDEESFPRKEKPSPLSEFQTDAPTKADEGRYLFLESLLSAKEYLIASYVNISPKDHKEQAPSLVLQELFSTIQKPLPHLRKVPHLHRLRKTAPPPFFSSFFYPTSIGNAPEKKELQIELKKLESCAKNPLKFFFHERLKLYLERSKDQGEEFNLSNFTKSTLRKNMLQNDSKKVFEQAFLQGKMPLGAFKASAQLRVEEEMKKGQTLIPQEVFSYDLHRHPLQIPLFSGGSATLTGKLNDISSAGLLFYGDDSLNALVRIWPLYLVFLHLQEKGEGRDLLLLKKSKRLSPPKEDPTQLLQKYLDYYQLCLQFPSPLIPDFAKALLEGSPKDLEHALYESTSPFEEDYLEWIKIRDPEIPCEILHANWSATLQTAFSPLLSWRDA